MADPWGRRFIAEDGAVLERGDVITDSGVRQESRACAEKSASPTISSEGNVSLKSGITCQFRPLRSIRQTARREAKYCYLDSVVMVSSDIW